MSRELANDVTATGTGIQVFGAGVMLSGVGAEAGAVIADVGAKISSVGFCMGVVVDYCNGDYSSMLKGVGFHAAGQGIGHAIGKMASASKMEKLGEDLLQTGNNIKMALAEWMYDKSVEKIEENGENATNH